MIEVWMDIEGYKDLYQISNLGRVKSLDYHRTGKERILKLSKNKDNYLVVSLHANKKPKSYLVHRLVAQAFIPNPDNLPEINHKSEIKSQNYVWANEDGTIDPEKSNLEWCDRAYNVNYGKCIEKTKEKLSKPIAQMTLDNQIITIWPSINEAGRNGFDQGAIWSCCNGKSKTHKGYKWQYANP
jgi:hypothetical protein